mgnify:FL=1
MKRLIIVALLIFVGFAGWQAGGALSTDAMGMAVGIVFGVLASLPAALLILVASRRSAQQEPPMPRSSAQPQSQAGHGQMPIVIMAPPAYPGYGQPGYGQPAGQQYAQLPGHQANNWAFPSQPSRAERSFTIVGEQSNDVDEW